MIRHTGARMGFQPRIRRGAFFEAAWRYGCREFSVYNRTYISSTFSDPIEEYWHVVNHVALWPVMGERQVEIQGPDAERFVQLLTPRDMSSCKVGQCKYALITSANGGILSDPIILRLAEDRFWLSTSDSDLELWVSGVAVNAGMNVMIRDAEVSVLQVQGPKSIALLADLFGPEIETLKYYWAVRLDYLGSELVVSRTGWSGEFGYELYLTNPELGDRLFDDVMTTGAPYGVKPGAVNQIRRIESGILSWGVDMTMHETPYDVGLGRLVQLDKVEDCIGRDALAAAAQEPPRWTLVGMTVDGAPLAGNEQPWPLMVRSMPVGKLTSLAYSPRLQQNIALGLVSADYAAFGTSFSVDTWDGERTAIVAPMPFVPKRQASDPAELLRRARADAGVDPDMEPRSPADV